MAVVSMDKLTLVGLNSDKEQILEELMALGAVEITAQDLSSSELLTDWSHLVTKEDRTGTIAQLNNQLEQVELALSRLARYNGGKSRCSLKERWLSASLLLWRLSMGGCRRLS